MVILPYYTTTLQKWQKIVSAVPIAVLLEVGNFGQFVPPKSMIPKITKCSPTKNSEEKFLYEFHQLVGSLAFQ